MHRVCLGAALIPFPFQELNHSQNELNMKSRSGAKTSTALEFESRLRETLENKNNTLETELAKAWSQTKSLMERLATLEADKGQLERELERVWLVE